jgi:putative MATE family efflux protein
MSETDRKDTPVSGRTDVLERDWTKGNTVRNLLSLSWPMMVTEGLYILGISIDMVWVGRLGPAVIAGVGVAGIFAGLQMLIMTGLSVGTRAMVARCVGADDAPTAVHAAQQAMVIALAYTVVMTAAGVLFAKPILALMGLEPDVVNEGAKYMRILFAGSVTVGYWTMAYSIMQAAGDVRTPLRIIVLFRTLHLALCPFLVLGWWVFPAMGGSGAALANLISRGLGMAIALWVLFTSGSRLRLTLKNFQLDPQMIWRMVKIGIPASVMGVQMSLGMLLVAWLMVPFGTLSVAAHSLMQRVEMLLFPACLGLGLGAGVLVGQNLGAGQPKRAEKSGWLAVGFAEVLMVICSTLILVWAEDVVRIFNSQPLLVETTSLFLRIAVAGYLVLGFSTVLMQAISGAGDTMPPMLISVLTSWGIQLPLAFILSRYTRLGFLGVRWALALGIIVSALAFTLYFLLGRWKRKRI